MSLVLYRKYRPKSFGEVVGQEHIIRTLTNAIFMGKVAHAYLFCGPRGTGKTTVARILAKAVNCESRIKIQKSRSYEPCNKCSACVEINEGRSLDIIEIDAASNRGIDEIRELREGIKFAPTRLKYKFFIIDEVHMLTREAFNALLKTLEEPPSHAIFVLATTEIHKVPQTIISRCQRFDFHKLSMDKIIQRLAQISKSEKVKIEKPALESIALNADGGMRDAESLLGQIMAMEDKEITLQEVQTILGTANIQAIVEMVDLIIKKDIPETIAYINKIVEEGYNLGQFVKSLINYFRKMMILKVDPSLVKLVASELTQEQFDIIISQGLKIDSSQIVSLIKRLICVENEVKSAVFPQLPLELAMVELLENKE